MSRKQLPKNQLSGKQVDGKQTSGKLLDSKQLNRIKRMESYLDEAALAVKELSLALEKYEKMEKKYLNYKRYLKIEN